MRAVPRCVPCVLEIAVNTVERAVPEDRQKEAILAATECVSELYRMEPTPQPPKLGTEAQRTVMKYSEDPDPYREEKRRANERAAAVAQELESDLENIEDPEELLKKAAAAAIVGNTIDFAVAGHEFDLDELREEISGAGFTVFDLKPEDFRGARVLYLCDNAGEIALDKLLIEVLVEELECDVVVAVRGGPIVNDATREDAEQVGITEICDVIDTGTEMLGLLTTEVSDEFAEELSYADVVISKGQGNFESIPEEPFPDVPVYFLLRAKCEPVAEELGVEVGSNVALRWEPDEENVRRWREIVG